MRKRTIRERNSDSKSPAGAFRNLCYGIVQVLFVLSIMMGNATAQVQTGGTWTTLKTHFPGCETDLALLLTDGSVLVHDYCPATNWYRLVPDDKGSYINGTWKNVSPIPAKFGYAPFAFASAVLPDGRVIIEGGEWGPCQNCGAIYNPVYDSWTPIDPPDFGDVCGKNGTTWCRIGGAQSVILPDGQFMMAEDAYGNNNSNGPISRLTALLPPPYDPRISPWIPAGDVIGGNGEEGWTLLPDSRAGGLDLYQVLMVDTYKTHESAAICGGFNATELYTYGMPGVPPSWSCLGQTLDRLWGGDDNEEVGPALLRPDGTVAAFGANQYNGILDAGLSWAAGPDFPKDSNGNQLEMSDGPAALLPNGNVLVMASPGRNTTPSTFLELTYGTNTFVQVPAVSDAKNIASSYGQMLVLPTGQVLFAPNRGHNNNLIEIYTPSNPNYDPSWAPQICGGSCDYFHPQQIHNNIPNQISGQRFNGMSQGSAFGDEFQSATNYPLVRITSTVCILGVGCPDTVYYCRTHDHTSMGVQTGNQTVSTFFDCPGVPTGTMGVLEVVANGIPSTRCRLR